MQGINNPVLLCSKMKENKLLNINQLNIILTAPMDYMRNIYIFGHIYDMSLCELFTFLNVKDDYKHIEGTEGTYVYNNVWNVNMDNHN